MALTQLPPEVLVHILDSLLYDIGIRGIVHLRAVCQLFNRYIPDIVYKLPTFEEPDDESPTHLAWETRMGLDLMAGLIFAKLKGNRHARALTSEIQKTLEFLSSVTGLGEADGYEDALVRLAVDALPVVEIVRRLSIGSDSTDKAGGQRPLETALAAALYVDNPDHVNVLLAQGAQVSWRTHYFGELMAIAACHARYQSFQLIAESALSVQDWSLQALVASRLLAALVKAAEYGREDIFREETWALVEAGAAHEPPQSVYASVLSSALLARQHRVADAVIVSLPSFDSNIFTKDVDSLRWLEILRLACAENHEGILSFLAQRTDALQMPHAMAILSETASRAGHEGMIRSLIALHDGNVTEPYTGAAFWAARNKRWDILAALLALHKGSWVEFDVTALCGASAQGRTGLSRVLEEISLWRDVGKIDEGSRDEYSEVIDLLCDQAYLTPLSPTTSAGSPPPDAEEPDSSSVHFREIYPFPPSLELQRLQDTCSHGDIVSLQAQMKRITLDSAEFYACYSIAIERNHPAILLYLCQKLPQKPYLSTVSALSVDSTAMFQLLLDQCWDLNEFSHRLNPPPLAEMLESEELTLWFLDHGADPNGRGDWDITPLSRAVQHAPLPIIALLVRRGGDTRRGQLLHLAVQRKASGQLAILDWLIASGLPINARMYENDPASWVENRSFSMGTPLHEATQSSDKDAVKFLLRYGADRTILDSNIEDRIGRDPNGRTAYEYAREIADTLPDSDLLKGTAEAIARALDTTTVPF